MSSASAVRLSPSVQREKLKLELLRGSRLKLESLPVSVVVHEHLVRAGCMFFGTATRRTLTRLHRLFSFCTVQSPAHHRIYRDARSRDRERGLRKLSGVDVRLYFTIRSAPFPTLAALRPSEGPQRSALVKDQDSTIMHAQRSLSNFRTT